MDPLGLPALNHHFTARKKPPWNRKILTTGRTQEPVETTSKQEKSPPLRPLINSTGNYPNKYLNNIESQTAKMDIIRQGQEEILPT